MNKILATLPEDEASRSVGDDAGFGTLETGKGPLPLKAMDVRTRIDGLLAHTILRQTFVNTLGELGEALEATYIFPLPDRAAVTRFRMEVAGRIVEGVLEERATARRNYDRALEAGQRAAIAEEERPGVFTLRVGNMMPGDQAVVELTFTGPLTYCDGEATWRFPLVVAPRYVPGTALDGPSVGSGAAVDTDAVPDASRISPPVLLPGYPNPVRLALSVDLRGAGLPIADVRSSLHAVEEETHDGCRHIRLQPGERLNRDFILRFRLGKPRAGREDAVTTSLLLHPDSGGTEGTFLLTLAPPPGPDAVVKPRDVIFVLDRSGSMGGWKMVAARRALARMVDTLTDHDRFTVLAFDDTVETPPSFAPDALTPATDRNRYRAVEFLARIEARGGTELARPLDRAVAQLALADPQRDRILVLVTDGQVGNEDQILRQLGQRLQGMRIFTLGIDQAVNEGFLKRLACLGGGCCELVESEDRLDEVMDRVHRRIGTPVLTGLRLESAGLEVDRASLTPSRLPDLFAGTPLLLLGRYRGKAAGAIHVQARDAAGKAWTQKLSTQATDNPALAWTWARGRVRELEDRYAAGMGDRTALEKQIVQTSLRFGVLCRFTSFVAIDVKEIVNPGGQVERITQPVEPAAGWAMLGTDKHAADSVLCCMAVPASLSLSVPCMAPPTSPPPPIGMSDTDADVDMQSGPEAFSVPAPMEMSGADTDADLMLNDHEDNDEQKKSRSRGSWLNAIGGIFGRVTRKEKATVTPPPVPAIDLTAYRRRAMEILKRLQAYAAGDRPTELGIASVQLAALIEDLRTIGVTEAILQPLLDLLASLAGLDAVSPAARALKRAWKEAETVLKAFSEDTSLATPEKRTAFWK